MYTSFVQCIPPLLMLHSRLTPVFKSFIPHFISSPSAPSPPYLAPGCPFAPPAFSSQDSLRVLQSNAGGLSARSTQLFYFLSSHPVNLICIHESNLNSSSSLRIPGFSALRSDCTYSRSGIFSRDARHSSGGVITFIRQGFSFSELSTSSVSSLYPYSDYVGVNISLNDSSCSFFLMCMPPYSFLLRRMAEPTPFLPPFSLLHKSLYFGGPQLPSPPLGLKKYLNEITTVSFLFQMLLNEFSACIALFQKHFN